MLDRYESYSFLNLINYVIYSQKTWYKSQESYSGAPLSTSKGWWDHLWPSKVNGAKEIPRSGVHNEAHFQSWRG